MQLIAALLPYIQIGISILLGAAILLQQSDAGLGEALGGSGGTVGYHTRRGFERVLFRGTIALGVLFVLSALVAILIK
ncbi:MAG: Uncharacterized protein G01um101448_224 [Parcubacteria group bacterium Gr01-1014_48]|nr:MAG: Uncharacterized protein Greene041614_652 [Parcubacteria group bacterium Greene0416_14]TSC74280.1 MAG: Uncharacterized protein G01um101448_224 [Parcubacteria group bacterium Gr01-1014_48]TSD01377.1 MAG: Uncharacterized protein Greene101415_312 [Parcubacteria group bacterium Greene1014_15]TSD08296.1 MAG: Uncharacterized protein Greene07144_214 [Parcubacteria group bacterium Greene0714_4]